MKNFKNMWEDKKYKSLIKLIAWFIFFIVVTILCSLSSNANKGEIKKLNNINEETFTDVEMLKNNLLVNSFNYEYVIDSYVDNEKIIYNGTINEGIDSGYYESKSNVFKYSCTKEKCYKVFVDHQEEYSMENYPLSYIILVFDLIKDVNPVTSTNDGHKIYNYDVNVQDSIWNVTIKTTYKDIVNISLKTSKGYSELKIKK